MRRSWVVVLTSFALVMGLGGLAFAAGGVPFIEDKPDAAAAAGVEKADLPQFDARTSEKPTRDALVKDESKDEVEPKDEVFKDDAKEEPKESDDKAKDEPVTEPPTLSVLYPENGAKVDDEEMVFEGTTTPGARVFAGKWEADVNDDGGWRIVLYLEPGTQTAKFHAESDGGVAAAAVTITRIVSDKPKEEEPKEEQPKFELVAHQVYGVCEAELPYDVFWGETKPGASVVILSEYGSGETVAGPEGEFEVRVNFPQAPYGVEFQVKVKSIDQIRYFGFTSYGNPPDGGEGGGEGA